MMKVYNKLGISYNINNKMDVDIQGFHYPTNYSYEQIETAINTNNYEKAYK